MSASSTPRLPSIIGAGPGRTGTTWLHRVLEGRVDLPYGVKETQFFSRYYDKGIDWYARHFRYATGARPIVEICPYLFDPYAPDRIKTHIPNVRVITTLRDPVEHSYSDYKMLTHFAWVRGSLEDVVASRPGLAGGNRYAFNLRKWFENFGRENVLITMYDELRARPQTYLDRVTDFMAIDRISLAALPEIRDDVHSFDRAPKNRRLARRATRLMYWFKGRQYYGAINFLDRLGVWDFCHGRGEPFPRLTPEQDASLRQRYLPEVEALEELLAIDLSAWKRPRASRAGRSDDREAASSAARA
ncbi:MAG TPA: sulfotransferase [Candidatus Binatus sp.]|nr:sulfotransferase [Candidatus Binatus sp.]